MADVGPRPSQGREFLSKPIFQMAGCPIQRFVQVAKIAGVGTAGFKLAGDAGAADFMASNRLEHPIGGVRHVAIVAGTPMRTGGMAGVESELGWLGKPVVALGAGPVGLAAA